jgi:hypothetical protein
MGFVITIAVALLVVLVLWLLLRRRGATVVPGEKSADPRGNRSIYGGGGGF